MYADPDRTTVAPDGTLGAFLSFSFYYGEFMAAIYAASITRAERILFF